MNLEIKVASLENKI